MSLAKPLNPIAIAKPWGGGHLDNFKNDTSPLPIGELVLYSTLENFPVTLNLGQEQVLARDYEIQLPFMIKLLSMAEPLSLQNHPADEDIKALGLSGCGKDECWFVVEAAADATIFLGLKENLEKEVLYQLADHPEPLSLFNAYQPQVGEIYYLPAGLIHGSQGRLLLYEIQQPSDYTFRIYDFGRNRPLHIEKAIQVYRPLKPAVFFVEAFSCNKFSLAIHKIKQHETWRYYFEQNEIVTWLGKEGVLLNGTEERKLHFANSFLAEKGSSLTLQGHGLLVRAFSSC